MQNTTLQSMIPTKLCIENDHFYFEELPHKEDSLSVMSKIKTIIKTKMSYMPHVMHAYQALSEVDILRILCSQASQICRESSNVSLEDKGNVVIRDKILKKAKKINTLLALHPVVLQGRATEVLQRAWKYGYQGSNEKDAIQHIEDVITDTKKLLASGILAKENLFMCYEEANTDSLSIAIPSVNSPSIGNVIPLLKSYVKSQFVNYDVVLKAIDATFQPNDFLAVLLHPYYFSLGLSKIEHYLLRHAENANFDRKDLRLEEALQRASSVGNTSVMHLLLRHGANPNFFYATKEIPLFYAKNFPAAFELLVGWGADVNFRLNRGRTPLHYTVKMNDVNFAQQLLNNKADVNSKDENGWAPLHLAASIGTCTSILKKSSSAIQINWIEMLVFYGASLEEPDNMYYLPLHRSKDCETAEIILNHLQKDINKFHRVIAHKTGDNENTILHIAAQNGWVAAIETLVKFQIDLNVKNKEGITPLYVAFKYGHSKIVELLLHFGADPEEGKKPKYAEKARKKSEFLLTNAHLNSIQSFMTFAISPALHLLLSTTNEVKALKKLIADGADIDGLDEQGRTPLHRAVTFLVNNSDKSTVALDHLIKEGANLDIPDKEMKTPLFYTLNWFSQSQSAAKKLLGAGANVNHRMKNGETILYLAAKYKTFKFAEILLSYEAELDYQEYETGNTALHEAARNNDVCSIKLLVSSGADATIKNKKGETPIDLVHKQLKGLFVNSPEEWNRLLFSAVDNLKVWHVKRILEKGAAVNVKNSDGQTPLHRAVDSLWQTEVRRQESIKIMKILLSVGANANAVDNQGKSALFYTINVGKVQILSSPTAAEILVNAGANVNHQMPSGDTLLHISAANRAELLYLTLKRLNADETILNNAEQTPLMLFDKSRSIVVVNY